MIKFVYNGWSMVEEVIEDGVGAVANTKTYQWGLDLAGSLTATGHIGALLSCTDQSEGQTYFYTYDANGNVSTLTDTTGTLAAAYDYSPFGQLIAKTGTYADANPFRFSAKYQDAITNLLYYGYRYYDSTKGRWINKDPIGERGGLNVYGFIRNNGINWIDLLGLEADCDCSEEAAIEGTLREIVEGLTDRFMEVDKALLKAAHDAKSALEAFLIAQATVITICTQALHNPARIGACKNAVKAYIAAGTALIIAMQIMDELKVQYDLVKKELDAATDEHDKALDEFIACEKRVAADPCCS